MGQIHTDGLPPSRVHFPPAGPLTIFHNDGTTSVVYPPMLWQPDPSTRNVVVDEVNKTLRSLPDQVKGWPPEKNEHGYNRAARRKGAKDSRKAAKASQKAVTAMLNAAAKKVPPEGE